MKRMLTPKEREKLILRHRKERDKRICDRIKAVLAYDDGYSYLEIARILLLDNEVRRHINDYQRENKLTIASGGSNSKLNDKESRALLGRKKNILRERITDNFQILHSPLLVV